MRLTPVWCRWAWMLLLVGVVTACGNTSLLGGSRPEPPPTFQVTGERTITVTAFSWCGRGFCADGFPSKPLPDIGPSDQAYVTLPHGDDWSMGASLTPAGESCGRTFPAKVHGQGHEFEIDAAGPPGTYSVEAWARSEDVSLSSAFRWTTTTGGPVPKPRAETSVIAKHDGVLDSYGIELTLHDLASTPERASAAITVTASSGESLTIPLHRRIPDCVAPGTVIFRAPEASGRKAARLGPAPFEYRIDLQLDGTTYRGMSRWPADLIPDYQPYTRAHFEPALPPYRG
jgi:hypothetical protein